MASLSPLDIGVGPAVIDEALIRACIIEDPAVALQPGLGAMLLKNKHQKVEKKKTKETIPYNEVYGLAFSFRNILKIDGIEGFANIKVLKLDNNLIAKIEGLNELTTLTTLETIEGLDKLTELAELSLSHNKISDLSGLNNPKLSALTICHNNLNSMPNLLTLRKFKKLRLLALRGNPVCGEADYKRFVLAHLPSLMFLDFAMVDANEVKDSRVELMELEETDRLEAVRKQEADVEAENRRVQKDAGVGDVKDLCKTLFDEEGEAARAAQLACYTDAKALFIKSYAPVVDEFVTYMLKQRDVKRREHDEFKEALATLKLTNDGVSSRRILMFEQLKRTKFEDADQADEASRREIRDKLTSVRDELMEDEIQNVTQDENMLGEYEHAYNEIITADLEAIQNFFNKVREFESKLLETIQQGAIKVWDQYSAGELKDIADEVKLILVEKDTLMNAVNAVHEQHINKIDSREDDLSNKVTHVFEDQINALKKAEHDRHRARVDEILCWCKASETGL